MAKQRTSAVHRNGAITLSDLARAIDAVSPLHRAASWDNVGLLLGDRTQPIRRAVLTIDLTQAVMDEIASFKDVRRDAAARRTAVVAYHPPIFDPLKRLSSDDPRGSLLLRAARELAGIVSPHTALDAVAGGVCDWLAEGVGAGILMPIEPATTLPTSESMLVATKLPPTSVDRVRDAMSMAGAGKVGAYTRCSFELAGHGTFTGDATTTPRVGVRERFERVAESKLEMVCSKATLPAVLSALRSAHPYEEPPIEVLALAPRPSVREGQGRILELIRPVSHALLARRLATHLHCAPADLEIVMPATAPRRGRRARRGAASQDALIHTRIGLCPGSGGSLLSRAIELGCTLFVTGEMKHHERLDAAARGCTVILAGHTETERGFLPRYRARLMQALPGLPVVIARSDRPPARRAR